MKEWCRASIAEFSVLLATGCSLVFDTDELRGGGSGGAGGGSDTGGGGQTIDGGGGAGGGGEGGAPSCDCSDRGDIVWLFVGEEGPLDGEAPACEQSSAVATGVLDGSISDATSTCGGSCVPPCSVRLQLTDDCILSGTGVSSCTGVTLAVDGPNFKIALNPPSCTVPDPTLTDAATGRIASVCTPDRDGCASPGGAHRCIPKRGECGDPCYAVVRSIGTLDDQRDCTGVLATCMGACDGELERHAASDCTDAALTTYDIMNASECEAMPVPASGTLEYWTFDATSPPCDGAAAPQGFIAIGDLVEELCCAD